MSGGPVYDPPTITCLGHYGFADGYTAIGRSERNGQLLIVNAMRVKMGAGDAYEPLESGPCTLCRVRDKCVTLTTEENNGRYGRKSAQNDLYCENFEKGERQYLSDHDLEDWRPGSV